MSYTFSFMHKQDSTTRKLATFEGADHAEALLIAREFYPSENSLSANSVTILLGHYVTNASPRLNPVLSLCQSVTTTPF